MQQQLRLKQLFANLIEDIAVARNELTCIMRLQPSLQSRVYKVKICFKPRFWSKVWLFEPEQLECIRDKKPHHIYNPEDNGPARLCVFFPKAKEWNDSMFLADALVPWIVTWLFAYEYWQISGLWLYPESKVAKRRHE